MARGPWSDHLLISLCAANLIGLATATAAWYGGSGTARTNEQGLWLSLGVMGLAIAAFGNLIWVACGRREIGRRRMSLLALRSAPPSRAEAAPPQDLGILPTLVRLDGSRRVHTSRCPMVAGKTIRLARTGDGTSCGVCRP